MQPQIRNIENEQTSNCCGFLCFRPGDALTVLDADDLDLCTILWATIALTVANLDDLLPRSGEYPFATTAVNSVSAGDCALNHSWQFTMVLLATVVTLFASFLKPVYSL